MSLQAVHTAIPSRVSTRAQALGWGRRLIARVLVYFDAWIEAREMASAAQRKYPFAEL